MEREQDGKLPILDSLLKRTENGTNDITVYRKPTHTEQYLSYESCHPVEHKKSVVNTLLHRAKNIVTKDENRKTEITHVNKALRVNGYPNWILNQQKQQVIDNSHSEDTTPQNKEHQNRSSAVIPYVKGLSEKLRTIMNQISVAFKPYTTLRNILVHPKDKTENLDKTGVVYKVQFDNCTSTYIGETERKTKSRISEQSR